jgi:hypothetical protein
VSVKDDLRDASTRWRRRMPQRKREENAMADGPEVVGALRDVVSERGWVLTSDGGNGDHRSDASRHCCDPH